jgi:hypothetical protein
VSDAAAYLAAAVLLGLAVYRAITDRRAAANYSPRSAVYGFVICEGLAMALLASPTADLLARLGVGALYVVLAGEIVRTAAISFLMLVGYALAPRPAPRFVIPAAFLVQAAMTATFLGAHAAMTADWSLLVRGAGRWLLAGHDTLFAGYAIWCLAVVIAALGREARRAEPGPLRLGLRLTLAAAAVGVLWSAWTADDVVDVLRSGVQDGSEDMLSNVLGALCATLVVAGTTVARWGGALAAPARWLRTYRTYARLGPLWEALRAELPQIALADRPRGFGAARPSGTEFALYRRVIEIDDGRLALRPYAHSHTAVAAALAPLTVDDDESQEARACLVEAVSIAAALANLRAGRRLVDQDADAADLAAADFAATPPATRPTASGVSGVSDATADNPPSATSDATPYAASRSGGVEAEAAWLLRVCEALTDSPAVRPALELLAAS